MNLKFQSDEALNFTAPYIYMAPSSKCIHDPIPKCNNSIAIQYRYRGKSPRGEQLMCLSLVSDDVRESSSKLHPFILTYVKL